MCCLHLKACGEGRALRMRERAPQPTQTAMGAGCPETELAAMCACCPSQAAFADSSEKAVGTPRELLPET